MNSTAVILIASDVVSDAELISKLLLDEFDNIAVSTNPDQAIEDFESQRPAVLILAFNTLEKAERYYLGLYRLSDSIYAIPHRTLILCNKVDLKRVYELCKIEYFDDYILFWPVPHDALRLPLAVHHALRRIENDVLPTAAEPAAQARRLSELDALVEIRNATGLEHEFNDLGKGTVEKSFQTVDAAVQPVRRWAESLKSELAPQLESTRALQDMDTQIKPVVLVVDDDEYQHKLLAQILSDENLELVTATNGTEALSVLRQCRPELILMDVHLPGEDGVETTRRLKSNERFASIPVIMITGSGAKSTVLDSMKAGAIDFVVKPFQKEVVVQKVRQILALSSNLKI